MTALDNFAARTLLQAKMLDFRSQLTLKNGDAYFTGVPNDLLEVVKVDHYVSFDVIIGGINSGCTMVEIGYSTHHDDGFAEWGIHYNETEALRFALGAWLA